MSQLFASSSDLGGQEGKVSMANLPMGTRHPTIKRYKMPLLPDEKGTKSGGDWVPGGMQSATNLAGSISETRALGIWERERSQLGLALNYPLYERLAFVVRKAQHGGIDMAQRLRDQPGGVNLIAELALIHEEARQACGANNAGIQGTNRHDVWEARAFSGQWMGTPQINSELQTLEQLLQQAGLERVPELSECVVRNTELNVAGRFDDVLKTTRDIVLSDGTLLPKWTLIMSDLKTKRKPFWSLLEVGIQLVAYASADLMLVKEAGEVKYIAGPREYVSQEWGAVLHAPSDGAPPRLIRLSLAEAMEDARLARKVCDARSRGKAVGTHAAAVWAEKSP